MTVRFGSDIVHLPKFKKTFQENKEYFAEKVFCSEEFKESTIEKIAGVFAAKEAVVKALNLGAGQWLKIQIGHDKSGKPFLVSYPQDKKEKIQWQHELSISHDGEYAIANVIFYS